MPPRREFAPRRWRTAAPEREAQHAREFGMSWGGVRHGWGCNGFFEVTVVTYLLNRRVQQLQVWGEKAGPRFVLNKLLSQKKKMVARLTH